MKTIGGAWPSPGAMTRRCGRSAKTALLCFLPARRDASIINTRSRVGRAIACGERWRGWREHRHPLSAAAAPATRLQSLVRPSATSSAPNADFLANSLLSLPIQPELAQHCDTIINALRVALREAEFDRVL